MNYIKDLYRRHRFFFNSVLLIYSLLLIILNVFDLGFSSSKITDISAPFWYFITGGGGVYGIAVSYLIFSFYVLKKMKRSDTDKKMVTVFMLTVLLIQLINAGSTYFIFKDTFKKMRPSQHYITGTGSINMNDILFLDMPSAEKKNFMNKEIQSDPGRFSNIYPPILSDWINETENSFPSGHSQSSFFIAVIFAFVISCTVEKNKIYLSLIPLLWALLVSVSRVVIGVHYNIDVTAGAALGAITGLLTVSIKKFSVLFKR
ncbi:MAG: phosphatase PAP2 family protein [Bacteroidetes bacterium]|nr:phosphatase PAP2 family protein [Bacteroidota bacterium]